MKTKLTLLLSFFALIGWGQIPVNTPKDYEYQKMYWANFVTIQKALFDVTIPAEERIMFLPNMFSMASGNWGTDWHGTVRNAAAIKNGSARKVAVFVFDTGAGYSNDRLKLAWWKGMGKQYTGDKTAIDIQGHSTHVSGIIGAVDESIPIGIAAELVKKGLLKVIPYEVLNDQGSGQFPWIAKATKEANQVSKGLIADGWFVIYNYSLGAEITSTPFDAELREAQEIGVFVAAAAGNSGRNAKDYPGTSVYTHAVASLAQNGQGVERSSFSTYGPQVEFAASGSRVLSTIPNNGLAEYSGTSMATPSIAGLAAIWASLNPTWTAKEVETAMKKNAFDIAPDGVDIYTGSGSPMVDSLLVEPPKDDPEEPDDPEEEPPTQDKRTITVNFNRPYSVMWKHSQGGLFKDMNVQIEVKLETRLYSEAAIADLYLKTDAFFTNRAFIIPKDDFLDAAFWVRFFYESIMKDQGLKLVVSRIDAEYEGLRGQPKSKPGRVRSPFVRTFVYGQETDVKMSMLLKEYNVKKGNQNFKPNESLWPVMNPKGFKLDAMIDSSCWYSLEDWNNDRDWFDYNKLKGITNYFTANNHTSALIAWRPHTEPYKFQIAAYTNYPKSGWTIGKPVTVAANTIFSCEADLTKKKVTYSIQGQTTEHAFAKRIWMARRTGTWMGGANNSDGPYGGAASKDMKMWIEFDLK